MGCNVDFGDDFEKCQLLIDEYEEILYQNKEDKLNDTKKEKDKEELDDLKIRIRDMLELINKKATGISQIDKLQKLNQKYQILLTEESIIIQINNNKVE